MRTRSLSKDTQAASSSTREGGGVLPSRTKLRKLLVMGWLWVSVGFLGGAQAHPADGHREKIGPGVLDTLRSDGSANVVIALVPPEAAKASHPDLSLLRAEIARSQQEVLSVLDAKDYAGRYAFRSVPALAGKVKSEAALQRLAAHPHVAKIDLDVGGRGGLATSVPLIGADLRHAQGNTGAGVVVAVIDSGLDRDHDDLAGDLLHEECFLDNDGAIDGFGLCPNGSDRQSGPGAAEDDAGHGTHVTGIITSGGVRAPVGVAPDAGVVAIKVTAGPSFSGTFFFFSEIVAALDYIIDNPQLGIRVINMSLGTFAMFPGDCDASTSYNMAGAAAIDTLRAGGVIAFASAGNSGSGTEMTSPACLSDVISVGATDNSDVVAPFSNSNASTDVFAPGVSILSDAIGNTTTLASGTSMASPHAAGCAALLIQSGEATTPDEIETRLETSPVHVTDPTNGLSFPRIDCRPGTPEVLLKAIVGGPDRPSSAPGSLRFETLDTSCGPSDTLRFYLNGTLLGSQPGDPTISCTCAPALQTFDVTDSALIASLWSPGGTNDFRITKSGTNATALAWSRVDLGGRTECIFDQAGGGCDVPNLCNAGFTFNPVDATRTIGSSDGVIDRAVQAGLTESSVYTFEVTYQGGDAGPVIIEDTVPAEWTTSLLDDDGGKASVRKPGGPASAAKITWEPDPSGGVIKIRAETSGPRSNGLFSPTKCGTLLLNEGAQAFLINPVNGKPLKDDAGNTLPPVAQSPRLCLAAVEDVDGNGAISVDGSGDEDHDGLSDYEEACSFSTSPCLADTDGDGFDDGDEVAEGSDPLSPNSFPAHVTLNNASTPRGSVFLSRQGLVGAPLAAFGGSFTGDVAWIGAGGVPGSELGCDTTPSDLTLTALAVPYGEPVAGKIALIRRGGCSFAEKVSLAESHGAVGVIVYNNAGDDLLTMGLTAGWPLPFGIPALFAGQGDGEAVAALRQAGSPDPLSATLAAAAP